MKLVPIIWFLFLSLRPMSAIAAGTPPPEAAKPAYRHAYYLFFAGTRPGCEDCYIPLLLTPDSLDQIATRRVEEPCVLIITYERDSIWHDDGIVSVTATDIEKSPRKIRVRDQEYRYQEVSSSEVLKLLENPMGTIPISRPLMPGAARPGPTRDDLISNFRGLR